MRAFIAALAFLGLLALAKAQSVAAAEAQASNYDHRHPSRTPSWTGLYEGHRHFPPFTGPMMIVAYLDLVQEGSSGSYKSSISVVGAQLQPLPLPPTNASITNANTIRMKGFWSGYAFHKYPTYSGDFFVNGAYMFTATLVRANATHLYCYQAHVTEPGTRTVTMPTADPPSMEDGAEGYWLFMGKP